MIFKEAALNVFVYEKDAKKHHITDTSTAECGC